MAAPVRVPKTFVGTLLQLVKLALAGCPVALAAAEAAGGFVVVRFAVGSNKVATQRFYVFPYPHVVSWSPVPGVINVNPVTARWTPIVAVVEVADGEVPYFGIKIGNLWWDVYDGHDEAFSLLFAAKSSITSLGQNQYQFSILPNGGWWRSTIDMRARTGLEVD